MRNWRRFSRPSAASVTTSLRGKLQNPQDVLSFALAGNATITIRSIASESRFTYKIKQCADKPTLWFLALMNGPDNENHFQYLGNIRTLDGKDFTLEHGRKSSVSVDAVSWKAISWFWAHVNQNSMPTTVECWHEGRCGKCNRKLTVPESIERGIGPECAKTYTVRNHLTR